jgi:hypothetical protein
LLAAYKSLPLCTPEACIWIFNLCFGARHFNRRLGGGTDLRITNNILEAMKRNSTTLSSRQFNDIPCRCRIKFSAEEGEESFTIRSVIPVQFWNLWREDFVVRCTQLHRFRLTALNFPVPPPWPTDLIVETPKPYNVIRSAFHVLEKAEMLWASRT